MKTTPRMTSIYVLQVDGSRLREAGLRLGWLYYYGPYVLNLKMNVMRLFEGTPFDRPPVCERCEKLESECQCEPEPPPRVAPEKQTARLQVEKRKKGKVVTVIRGLEPDDNDLPELLTTLKNKCGAGGTLQDDCLEIQGKHLDRVADVLTGIGYKIRK